jgi:hypothetical protein
MDTINILLSRLFGESFIPLALCKKHIPQGELTKADAAAAKHRHCHIGQGAVAHMARERSVPLVPLPYCLG